MIAVSIIKKDDRNGEDTEKGDNLEETQNEHTARKKTPWLQRLIDMPSEDNKIETAVELHTKGGMMPRRLRRTLFEHFFFLFSLHSEDFDINAEPLPKIPQRTSFLNLVLLSKQQLWILLNTDLRKRILKTMKGCWHKIYTRKTGRHSLTGAVLTRFERRKEVKINGRIPPA